VIKIKIKFVQEIQILKEKDMGGMPKLIKTDPDDRQSGTSYD
jgi:hypothetical protein